MATIIKRSSLWLRRHFALILILLAYVMLGAGYSISVPIFEAPDEPGHFYYIKYLAEERRLPVQSFRYSENIVKEGHQPPLYYWLGALTTFWVDMSDIAQIKLNPHFAFAPMPFPIRNAFLHSDIEMFPYRGAFLAIHMVRLLSVLMGGVTVWATYQIARHLSPGDPFLPLGAAALNAFVPQFIFIDSVVNNDSLATALSSLILLSLVRLQKDRPASREFVVLGVFLGLGLLTKASLLVFVPLAVLVILIPAGKRESSARRLIGHLCLALSISASIAGWWYLRNRILYGDPLGWQLWKSSYSMLVRAAPPSWLDFREFLRVQHRSFWAQFGWMTIQVDDWIYSTLRIVLSLGAVGLLLLVAKRERRNGLNSATWAAISVLALAILFTWVSILRLVLTFDASSYQGRFIFPAISAISILLLLGLGQLFPRGYEWVPTSVVGLGMLFFATLSLFLYIRPSYAQPPPLKASHLQNAQHLVHIRYDDKIELIGHDIDKEMVRAGESLNLTLYWRCLAPMEESYVISLRLLCDEGNTIAEVHALPYDGRYPTLLWKEGDLFRDQHEIQVSDSTKVGHGTIELGLYTWPDPAALQSARVKDGQPIGHWVTLFSVDIVP